MCPLCGKEIVDTVGDDVFLYYLRPARMLIADSCASLKKISETQSPICTECMKLFQQFVRQRAGILGAEFLVFYATKMVRSRGIRDAIAEARRNGTRLGRPPKYTPEERDAILALRGKGLSYRQIEKQTGFSHSFVGRALKA